MKQVLLIGDSIRMGYCEAVKEALNDCAEVIFPSRPTNETRQGSLLALFYHRPLLWVILNIFPNLIIILLIPNHMVII